ncbi:unnamed protein product [Rhodiola kirilowii]
MDPKAYLLRLISSLLFFVALAHGNSSHSYLYHICEEGIFTSGSNYQINVNILLFRQFYENSATHFFYNATVGEIPDQVHGLYLCRGDISGPDCKYCVDRAAQEVLIRRCRRRKNAMIWFEGCFIRYANSSFISKMDTESEHYIWSDKTVSEPLNAFDQAVTNMLRNLTGSATYNPSKPNYAATEVRLNSLTLYGYVQCTPDVLGLDCRSCLEKPVSSMFTRVQGKKWLQYLSPSCNLRYDIHPFTSL